MRRIVLCDASPSICREWSNAFSKFPEVAIVCNRFENILDFTCMVTAGNSFGIMDGGIDLSVRNFFGVKIQKRVQDLIREQYCGEMPVGACLTTYSGNNHHPLLAYAPTMQRPMPVPNSMNAYYAMLATMIAIRGIKKGDVIIPGFCGGAGKMPPSIVARQMAAAYENHLYNSKWPKLCWDDFKIDHSREKLS